VRFKTQFDYKVERLAKRAVTVCVWGFLVAVVFLACIEGAVLLAETVL
jgi:hypothetical protein